MTQHIKKIYLIFLVSISLFARETNKEIFSFYKAFATCEIPFIKENVYAYSEIEAHKVYKDTKIDLKNYSCTVTERIFENADLYFKDYVVDLYDGIEKSKYEHFYSDCAYKNLGFKVLKQEICTSTNEDNIFDEIFILNNQYLITNIDSFYFMFNNIGLVSEFQPTEQQLHNENAVYDFVRKPNQLVYKEPNENTKMDIQLNVRDLVEILEEKEDWIYILYITKDNKKIKAWIPKSAFNIK